MNEEITLKSFLAAFITPIVKNAVREELRQFPKNEPQPKEPFQSRIGGVDLAMEITGKAESTIYNLVSAGKIPHSKQSGKLYFSESDLLQWIQQGKRKSLAEFHNENDVFLGSRKGGRQLA